MWWCQSWLSDWNDSRENSDYLSSSHVILMSITYMQKTETWLDLLCVLEPAPSWLQAYQVEGRTGWWTDWGIGRASPSPASPGSLPPSLQEIHRLCLWRWLHQGPWKRKEEPFRIVAFARKSKKIYSKYLFRNKDNTAESYIWLKTVNYWCPTMTNDQHPLPIRITQGCVASI